MLARIQNDLFDLGADLCRPGDDCDDGKACASAKARSSGWNARSTRMNAELRPLNSFVLPGGSAAAAYLHLARTVTRRAERLVCELAEAEAVNPGGDPLFKSSIGPSICAVALGQRQGRGGRALDTRSQSLIRRSYGN